MAESHLLSLWEFSFAFFTALTVVGVIFIFTLPSQFEPHYPELVKLADFTDEDKKDRDSGYEHLPKESAKGVYSKPSTSVVILILGDIGRSPRMQYHACSIAKYGGRVDIVGYHESEVLPEIQRNKLINIVPLKPFPDALRTDNKILFTLLAPVKILLQAWTIYYTLAYSITAKQYMLVQNPPSIPTLLIAQINCFLRNTKLVIDWHNLGHTILALKLGRKHPLVILSSAYENIVARFAAGHITVSKAMARLLQARYGIVAKPLHDRPAKHFQPLSSDEKAAFLARFPRTAKHAKDFEIGKRRLVVSSTSWTADEDFTLLLDALVAYSATVSMEPQYPKLEVVITGKGPLRESYLKGIKLLEKGHRLVNVKIHSEWLTMADYALLLGSADLGVSLHTSSSGVDLPMKVVDMFGTGLPVVGWDHFEAWPELVQEGVDGKGFHSASGLEQLLQDLLGGNGTELARLRKGALEQSRRRWEHEWPKIGGLLGLRLKEQDAK